MDKKAIAFFEYCSLNDRLTSSCTIFVILLVHLRLSCMHNSFQSNQNNGQKRRLLERKTERNSNLGKKLERVRKEKWKENIRLFCINVYSKKKNN